MVGTIRANLRCGVGGVGLLAAISLAMVGAGSASAATVVNGDFETGNLNGWQVHNSSNFGNWYAYSGSTSPASKKPVSPPPAGNTAAISDESAPDTAILYQDIALEPYYSQKLSLTLYYSSLAPIGVPTPNTLTVKAPESKEIELAPPLELLEEEPVEPKNQQLRVDVMKPSAPIESLNPSDILATIFASKNGDAQSMAPTQLTADLTPFAGQTIRLRIANAVHEEVFNAGVDAVSITSTPPSNSFTLGTLKRNRRAGSASIAVTVPGPGTISVTDALSSASAARAAAASAGKKPKSLIKSVTTTAANAGAVSVTLKPTGAGRKVLLHRRKLKEKVLVSFTPTGGAAATQTLTPVLSLRAKKTKGK